MNKIKLMDTVVSTMEAYITTNKEYLDEAIVSELNEALAYMYDEQRLWSRTVMLITINNEPIVEDVTDFYDLQVSYDNDIDPDILASVAQLMHPNKEVAIYGYASPIDNDYWVDAILLGCDMSDNMKQSLWRALTKWVEVNK